MNHTFSLTIFLILVIGGNVSIHAFTIQDNDTPKETLETIAELNFEDSEAGKPPKAWTRKGVEDFSVEVSDEATGTGKRCLKLESKAEGAGSRPVGALEHQWLPDGFRGKRVRFRATIKTSFPDEGQVMLFWREDLQSGEYGVFDQMADRPVKSGDWKQQEIVADISHDAKSIGLGFLICGKGIVLVDDVVIEIVDDSIQTTAVRGGSGPMGNASAPGLFKIAGSMEVRTGNRVDPKNGEAKLLMPLPLLHRSQYPLTYHLQTTPREALKSVRIVEDKPGNFVAHVTLQDMGTHQRVGVEFSSAVLVLKSSFDQIPDSAAIPSSWPAEAQPWLKSTWCVNSDHDRIQEIAKGIRSESDDVFSIIKRVEESAKSIFGAATGQVDNLTAVEALDHQGSCTSCGNLVAALLRASNVPARVVAGYPSWSGPLQTHYIVEAYIPEFGWYPIESTMCRSPWPNKNQVNVSIVPPEYESRELAGQRPGVAGGVPYLSRTEIAGGNGQYFTVGTIPDHPGCDHQCRFIGKISGNEAELGRAADWSSDRWKSWLKTQPKVTDGSIGFGPPVAELQAESVDQLIKLIDFAK